MRSLLTNITVRRGPSSVSISTLGNVVPDGYVFEIDITGPNAGKMAFRSSLDGIETMYILKDAINTFLANFNEEYL